MDKSYSIGDKYGRLTIESVEYSMVGKDNRRVKKVRCSCECGGKAFTYITMLRNGSAKSCGCLRKEIHTTHGQTRSAEHNTWSGMLQRCLNKKNENYVNYGGREITVCKEWKKFENFYGDMGERPAGTSLDRIDNNKGYSKENCKWSTPKEQNNNTSRNIFIEYNGEKLSATQWERKLGFNLGTFISRIQRGWTVEKAMDKTLHKGGNQWKKYSGLAVQKTAE